MGNIEKLVRETLAEGFLMNLGTSDEKGPWVASVIYVFDGGLNLY